MRKTSTKVFALLLALAMFATMAVPAMAKTNKTSYDFFRSVGATKALQVLNDSSLKQYVNRNSTDDAVNLDNMLASLDMIDQTNKYRSGEGLSALKVTDSMMAIAQVNADYARTHKGHLSNNYARLDNMGWGYSSPSAASTSWYNEKYTHKNGEGHYKTMMGRNSGLNSTVTGAGYYSGTVYLNGEPYDHSYNETFDTNRTGEQTYTVAQYRNRLKNYMNNGGSSRTTNTSNQNTNRNTNTSSRNNTGTTYNNGVYSCTATTVVRQSNPTGTKSDYKDFRGPNGTYAVQNGKVIVYVQEMVNDDLFGFYADIRIVNGTGKTIKLDDITKLAIYSDDGLICSSPRSAGYAVGKTISPNGQCFIGNVKFNNIHANRNFTTGMLRVESTVTYTYA